MRSVLAALAVLPVAFGAISITGPSSTEYWVQNTSNTIYWTYNAGDPNPIDIVVYNIHNTTLNGNFSIAQYVNVSQEHYTITDVTLVVGSDYVVQFVNPANGSQIYATSQSFSVEAPGTAPAPTSSAVSSSASSTGSGSASGSAASSTSPSSSGSGSGAAKSSAASPRAFSLDNASGVVGLIVACGVASLSALLL